MESRSLQDLVKKVFSEEKTRTEFMTDPESVISRFTLTAHEKQAVLATRSRLGLVNGSSPTLDATIEPLIFWI
jgi:hypothetical protein